MTHVRCQNILHFDSAADRLRAARKLERAGMQGLAQHGRFLTFTDEQTARDAANILNRRDR